MQKVGPFGWRTIPLMLIAFFCLTAPPQLWAQGVQGVLDNPQPHSVQSGIGLINGWVCDAEEVLIAIDEFAPFPAAYGTTRADTRDACGDDDNGFGLTFNWNLLGEGLHRLRITADGSEVAAVAFVVATLGLGEFPRGLAGGGLVEDFPTAGGAVEVEWQESLQNFVLTGTEGVGAGGSGGGPSRVLDNPQPGAFQSGAGLISGFVCEASAVSIQIDDLPALSAAYGTTRADTVAECGDDDNGFGITFNWNLVGDGEHRVRAFADGGLFADVTVAVTTLNLGEFPRLEGLPTAVGSVSNFPQPDSRVSIQWQDSKQNFIVEGLIPPGREAMRCDSQEGAAFDQSGVMAFFRLLNLCSLNGETARIDVRVPVQSAQQKEQEVEQAQEDAFEFCAGDLSFEQGETAFRFGDFQVLDGRGNEVACQEITLLEQRTFTINIEENIPLTFREPSRVLFNDVEVLEIEVVCGDGEVAPSEACDGTNLGGETCQSQGFEGGTLSCDPSCGLDTSMCTTIACGDGSAEGSEACDGSDLNGQDCPSLGFDGGTLSCGTTCSFDTTGCFQCGDGVINPGEACDGTNLGGETCQSQGFAGGTLSCSSSCGLDTTGCFECGDGVINPGEACDGTNLGGETCQSQGFDGGTLSCSSSCGLDTLGCTVCGNGIVEAGEQCDGSSATCTIGDTCTSDCLCVIG